MGRLRDFWRRWRRQKSGEPGRRSPHSACPAGASLPVTLAVPRGGRVETVVVATRDQLQMLRSEFELLRLFALGDSADALRILDAASRTSGGQRYVELCDHLREARQAGVSALCRQIDELFPGLAAELAHEVLAREARSFRASVLRALREAPVEGHLEVAVSYALSADLRPVAPAGAVRSASDTNMSQSENPNMAESPKDSGGASLEDALQAMESELQGLTEIVSAQGAVDKGLDQMVNGSPPQAPPAAEVFDEASDETDEADEVDHFNEVVDEVVDEVLLGEDAAPTDAPPPAHEPQASAEPLDDSFRDAIEQAPQASAEPPPADVSPIADEVDALTASLEPPAHNPASDAPSATEQAAQAPREPAEQTDGRTRQADDPEPSRRRASRPSRRLRSAHAARPTCFRSGDVETAIANLAEFLQNEVAGMWEEARAALDDVIGDADEVAKLHARAAELQAEMERMQAEVAATRKESRLLQAQLLNLRDEVAQAKQRADTSAHEAQAAADRAKAAAREAETAARFNREP